MKKKSFDISNKEKELTKSLLEKILATRREKFSIVDLDVVYGFLNREEITFLKKLLTINPTEYGFKGEYVGIQDVPKGLVEIKEQRYTVDTEKGFEEIGVRYLSKEVYKAYKRMNNQMYKDIGKRLLVGSGYRSPAYQLFLFVYYLNMYDFKIEDTIKRVAMPGYSEHCVADSMAIDFVTTDGIPNENDDRRFENTAEYRWLLDNGEDFGFKESYPKDNEFGISYEPWHWRYHKELHK